MEEKFISRLNLDFLLYDVFNIEEFLKDPYFEEFNRESIDLIIGTAHKLAVDIMRPCLREMDSNPPEYKEGQVYVHPSVKKFIQKCGEVGFISAHFPAEAGGQQLPYIATAAANYIFSAANYSLSVYPGLTSGAAGLIAAFAPDELKDFFLPKMFSGEWQGTMALTEPEAGSSLSDIKTKAKPTNEGFYLISGQKIFISCGTHNAVDNVVHLMLARIEGAPAGVKGISLFAVPKLRGDGKGGLEPNDLFCGGIEHKLGYRGSPIAQLHMGEDGDCRGWLLGQENMGLAYMFQMMNEERINVGIGAAGIASAAYYDSLKYAGERAQGRPLNDKNPLAPQCPIISHPDVKRMLLYQKAISEGSLSLALQTGKYVDLKTISSDSEKEKYDLLLEFLTPVAKSYPAENGILSTSAAIQILGGYGYCSDFNVELYFRDSRIHPIHEGTTAIQGQDMLGRKVLMKKGRAFELFIDQITSATEKSTAYPELAYYGNLLESNIHIFRSVTEYLTKQENSSDNEVFLSDATLYLELTGIITIAWQWLLQGIAAAEGKKKESDGTLNAFYDSKIHTMKFFFKYEVPKIQSLFLTLIDENVLTAGIDEKIFTD